MMDTVSTLLDRLNEIVDKIDIEEVQKILGILSKINRLKCKLEKILTEDTFYETVFQELDKEFYIKNLKVVHFLDDQESILYEYGEKNPEYTYVYKNKVSRSINIHIYVNITSLDEYKVLTLNTYFKEIVHLLYIQQVLLNIKQSSTTDPLTQLQNRTSFNIEMKTLVPLAIREKMKFGVLLINIDRFRAVNDEHGDEFGDEFLKLYANVIKNNIRSSDIAVRFSGGEFLVLFVNVESEEITLKLAEKIKKQLTEVHMITSNNDKFQKTVCIGVSMFPKDSEDINEVIKFTEMALSDAQDKGRNNIKDLIIIVLEKLIFFRI